MNKTNTTRITHKNVQMHVGSNVIIRTSDSGLDINIVSEDGSVYGSIFDTFEQAGTRDFLNIPSYDEVKIEEVDLEEGKPLSVEISGYTVLVSLDEDNISVELQNTYKDVIDQIEADLETLTIDNSILSKYVSN